MSDCVRSLLIVEKLDAIGKMLALFIRQMGHRVFLARDGLDAVQTYREHRDITAVLLDVNLPGPDGPATLEMLRELNPLLPAIFVAASFSKYSEADLEAYGSVHVLLKPFDLGALARILERITPTFRRRSTG